MFHYAVRFLLQRPDHTAVVLLTLALGIGASTAIYSLKGRTSLPYDGSDRLVRMWGKQVGADRTLMAHGEYWDYRNLNTVYEDVAAFRCKRVVLAGEGEPLRVAACRFTASMWQVLRYEAFLGSTFSQEEAQRDSEPVAVLSHGFWQRRFGGARGALGREIRIDGIASTVIGVMPPGFDFPNKNVALWIPQILKETQRSNHHLRVLGRLREGVTLEDVRREADAIAAAWEGQLDHMHRYNPVALDAYLGPVREPLYLQLSAMGLVLLIVCVNVACLLLVHGETLHRENEEGISQAKAQIGGHRPAAPRESPLDTAQAISANPECRTSKLRLMVIPGMLFAVTFIQFVLAPELSRYGDYTAHAHLALRILTESQLFPVPYPIFHYTLVIIYLFGFEALTAAVLAAGVFAGASAVVAWFAIYKIFFVARPSTLSGLVVADIVMLTFWLGPISLFTFPRDYLGYLPVNVYHNPTTIASRPFTLALFFYIVYNLLLGRKPIRGRIWISALAITSALAKPSYAIAILPAVAVYVCALSLKNRKFLWRAARDSALWLAIPTMTVLMFQYHLTFRAGGALPGGIVWAPLLVLNLYTTTPLRDSWLSIALPLVVAAAYFRHSEEKPYWILALIQTAVSLVITMLFAEPAPRTDHGNFFWTVQQTQTVLFIIAIATTVKYGVLPWVEQRRLPSGTQLAWLVIVAMMVALHLLSGIVFWLNLGGWQAAGWSR